MHHMLGSNRRVLWRVFEAQPEQCGGAGGGDQARQDEPLEPAAVRGRAGRYGAWKEEGRLREAGAAMLADPAYGPMLDGIGHSREWIKWADQAIPSWHAEEARRLEALQGASVRR